MAKVKTIKVVARAGRIVSDRHALASGGRRFVGRGHFPSLTLTPAEHRELPSMVAAPGVHPPRTLPFVEIPHHTDYVLSLRHGDLVAYDEDTAKLCGVPFQPELLKESEVVDEDHGMIRVATKGEAGDLEAHEQATAAAEAKADEDKAAAGAKELGPFTPHEGDHQ